MSCQKVSKVNGYHRESEYFCLREKGVWSLGDKKGAVVVLGCFLLYELSSFWSPVLSSHLWNLCSLLHGAAAMGKGMGII